MDRLIQRYDVYKVETISSVYMCVSGIPIRNGQRHVTEIARMSLDIIAAAQQFRIASMPEVRLSLRIGAHTGKTATQSSGGSRICQRVGADHGQRRARAYNGGLGRSL